MTMGTAILIFFVVLILAGAAIPIALFVSIPKLRTGPTNKKLEELEGRMAELEKKNGQLRSALHLQDRMDVLETIVTSADEDQQLRFERLLQERARERELEALEGRSAENADGPAAKARATVKERELG